MVIDQDPPPPSLIYPTQPAGNGTNNHHLVGLEHQATSMADVPSKGEDEAWQSAIEKVRKCVVSIKYERPWRFDTEFCNVGEATGFVVDTQSG